MQTDSSHSWFKETALPFLKALGIVIVFSPWLLVAYAAITQYTITLDKNDQDAIKGFIEWFGTAYSFFLALALVNVWSQFDTVDREFDRELDAMSTLLQTVKYTAETEERHKGDVDEFKKKAREGIKKYIAHVVKYYNLEHIVAEQKNDGDRLLKNVGTLISDVTRKGMILEPYIYELFQSFNEAIDVRGDRISHAKPYTPTIIHVVAVVSSLVWLFSFLALPVYDRLVALVLIGGVAFVIIMVLIIFFDLGEPFGGIWKIHLDDWQEFLDGIDHEQDPRLVFVFNRKNSVQGRLRALVRIDTCRIYSFIFSRQFRYSWKGLIWRMERTRTGGNPSIKCRAFHNNELDYSGYSIAGSDWPQVLLKLGDDIKVVLNSHQINGCQDVIDLELLLDREMKQHLCWY